MFSFIVQKQAKVHIFVTPDFGFQPIGNAQINWRLVDTKISFGLVTTLVVLVKPSNTAATGPCTVAAVVVA